MPSTYGNNPRRKVRRTPSVGKQVQRGARKITPPRKRTTGSPSMPTARPKVVRRTERKATRTYEAKRFKARKRQLDSPSMPAARTRKRKAKEQRANVKYRRAEREFVKERAKADRYARLHGYGSGGKKNAANALKPLTLAQQLERSRKRSAAGQLVDELDRRTQPAQTGAVNILREAMRPVHGSAGAAYAAASGKNVVEGAKRGVMLKSAPDAPENTPPVLYSDVLKKLGAPKGVQAVGGFAADVALDPITYVTFGTGSVAAKAGQRAARKTLKRRESARKAGTLKGPKAKPTGRGKKAEAKAYRKARAAGKSPDVARSVAVGAREATDAARRARRVKTLDVRAARRSQRKARAKVPEGRGLQARAFGMSTSGATTARLKPKRMGTRDVPGAALARETLATVSPHVRPAKEMSEKEFRTVKGVGREQRAATTRGRKRAVARGEAFQRAIPKERVEDVIDAIERGTVYDLPAKLRAPAEAIEREFKAARKAERRAGIDTAHVSNTRYFSHLLADLVDDVAAGKKGGTTIRPGYAKERQFKGTIRKIEQEGGPKFSKNVGLVVADRLAKSAGDVAKAKRNRALVQTGRVIGRGDTVKIGPDDAVVAVKGAQAAIVDLKDTAAKRAIAEEAGGDTTFVVMNKRFAESQLRATAPGAGANRNPLRLAYDKTTGKLKWLYTVPNPGFHMRNLYGDTCNAFLAQSAPGLARSTGQSARVLRRVGRRDNAERKSVGGKPKAVGWAHHGPGRVRAQAANLARPARPGGREGRGDPPGLHRPRTAGTVEGVRVARVAREVLQGWDGCAEGREGAREP